MAGVLAQQLAIGQTAEELAQLDQRLSGMRHHVLRVPQPGSARLPARLRLSSKRNLSR